MPPAEPVTVQRIAAKAVISNTDGKILILREAKTYEEGTNIGKYSLPGGRINVGEPFMEALRREIDEETGLTVEVGPPIFVGEWFPNIKGVQNQIVGIFFACTAASSEVRLNLEHDQALWIDAHDYAQYVLVAPEGDVISAWISRQG